VIDELQEEIEILEKEEMGYREVDDNRTANRLMRKRYKLEEKVEGLIIINQLQRIDNIRDKLRKELNESENSDMSMYLQGKLDMLKELEGGGTSGRIKS
jgi:hypothetical protein